MACWFCGATKTIRYGKNDCGFIIQEMIRAAIHNHMVEKNQVGPNESCLNDMSDLISSTPVLFPFFFATE
jgi:hypothetical protein